MKNSSDGQQHKNSGSSNKSGFIPSSFRAVSSYLRIVSNGASSVARSAASVAQSIVDRDDVANPDQVLWAGFDKLESEHDVSRKVLLLGFRSGFQVWDVEEADNVCDLVSRHDGSVSLLQMQPKPLISKQSGDKFADNRPLLVLCSDGAVSGLNDTQNENIPSYRDSSNNDFVANIVRFYSLRSQSYVHEIKFRSVIFAVRCSSRIVAIAQLNQIHCFNSTTLEREYTLLTNPVVTCSPGSSSISYGPLAVGPRWLAYSGGPVVSSNNGCVSPEHLKPSVSFNGFSSNGSLVAHYAKESSKHIAAGIATLGDIGYKKLSRYCSELLPDSLSSVQSACHTDGHFPEADSIGMVVVRDIVSKRVISQFKAHKSPISALCFDPSGTLLVTASMQGHSINIFKIMPGSSSLDDSAASYVHLYRLQRGYTNAVIQDISFSEDSNWIMISSSRGTSHLFAINTFEGSGNQTSDVGFTTKTAGLSIITKAATRSPSRTGSEMHNQDICASNFPVTLSVVSRIRNSYNGWRGTVTSAAAAATGRLGFLPVPIASSFHKSKAGIDSYVNGTSLRTKYHLLVFSPSGCMIQYALQVLNAIDSTASLTQLSTACDSSLEGDGRLLVEPIKKWSICLKQSRREREDNIDIYGENGYVDSNKIFPADLNKGNITQLWGSNRTFKAKFNPDEKHHMYISEAELQMHQALNPLWAKPEICFQAMFIKRLMMNKENIMRGETEIEWLPTRTIEVRSKNLIPVPDYLQTLKAPCARVPATDPSYEGGLQQQQSGWSENGRLSCRSSSGSLDTMFNGGEIIAERQNGIEEVVINCPVGMSKGTLASVNINDSPKTDTAATVNNRESSRTEAQLKFVNNNNNINDGDLEMENHFGGDNEFN